MVWSQSLKSPMSTVQTPRVLFLSCLLLLGASATEGQEIKDIPSPDSGSDDLSKFTFGPCQPVHLGEGDKDSRLQAGETLLAGGNQAKPEIFSAIDFAGRDLLPGPTVLECG